MGLFFLCIWVYVGCLGGGGVISSEHSFIFCNKTQQASPVWELVNDVGRACSIEVEALLHSGSEEALSHDLFGGIFRQLQVVHTRVN